MTLAAADTCTTPTGSGRAGRRASDFVAVIGAWLLAIAAAAVLPLHNPPVARVALFVHVVSMAVGFGAVVMTDVYGILWLLGFRTMQDIVSLAVAAHGVISLGVGGLLASGIALRPDLSSPLARLKLGLVLALMLNGVAAQRMLHGFRHTLSSEVSGANVPWAAFQRMLATAVVSQSTWWGAIAIGFLTNADRHG
ncbi:MAG: hypothetical protein QOE80_1201 [Actinomycetota bacterium]|nr:hypothetical protein [Actinomycetota bacterium]